MEHAIGFNPLPDSLGRAMDAARRAVDLAPANAGAHLAVASVYFFLKKYPEFRVSAIRAMELNPCDGATLGAIGLFWGHALNWEDASELILRARQLHPRHPDWYYFVDFWTAYRKEDYLGALEVIRKMGSGPHWASYMM